MTDGLRELDEVSAAILAGELTDRVLIALAGCYRGLQVRNSARELGHKVTVAVVEAIFLVILVDALFAVLFMKMDI